MAGGRQWIKYPCLIAHTAWSGDGTLPRRLLSLPLSEWYPEKQWTHDNKGKCETSRVFPGYYKCVTKDPECVWWLTVRVEYLEWNYLFLPWTNLSNNRIIINDIK